MREVADNHGRQSHCWGYDRVQHVWNVMAHTQKPDLVFQRNGRVHLNWQGVVTVQSTTGSRGVCVSGSNGSNAGYTMFWGRVQDYWLPIPLACFPFTSLTVGLRVPSGFNWALPSKYPTSCLNSSVRKAISTTTTTNTTTPTTTTTTANLLTLEYRTDISTPLWTFLACSRVNRPLLLGCPELS